MKKTVFKLISLSLVCLLAFSALAACGEQTPAVKDTVVIATANEPPTMHPYDHNAVAGSYMNILTFDTLFRTNIETLEPEPSLAESYEILGDKQWKFVLREGVKFHNGETMTAEDVKASLEYQRQYDSYTSVYNNFWESIEVVDEKTLIINTKEIYAKTLYDLVSCKVVPKSLIESGNNFKDNPIGTGPYKFLKWNLGESIEFEAFEEYFEGAPAIKKLTYKIIPEGSSRTIGLEAGEIDFVVEVETNDIQRIKDNANLTLLQKTGTSFNFMMINNEKEPFDNLLFRKALNYAIDKEAVMQVALNGAGSALYVQTPAVLAGNSNENAAKYDPELAKQYLTESGVDPATVSFKIICSDDTKKRAGEVIQDSLRNVLGINVELESMDLATYLSKTAEGDYEAAIGGYTSSNMMSFIEGVWTTKSIGGSNKTRLSDAEVDRLYYLATSQLDAEERNATLAACSARLNELYGQVPTYGSDVVRAYSAKLQGVELSATGTLYWQYVSWAE